MESVQAVSTQPLKIEVMGLTPIKEPLPLTEQEKRALMGLLAGMGNPQIAKQLGYTPRQARNTQRQRAIPFGHPRWNGAQDGLKRYAVIRSKLCE